MDARTRRRRRRARRRRRLLLLAFRTTVCLLSGFLIFGVYSLLKHDTQISDALSENLTTLAEWNRIQGLPESVFYKHPEWEEAFLTPNEYSRPGDRLREVKNIFVHYTANINTSAMQNRNYFEQLGDTQERSASAHFIIGYDGEIVQCIPLDEIAYAVKTRNMDSISIECCYIAEDASFTQETYDSLVGLLKWLTEAYDLSSDDILRHYDCGGKACPLYYVENPDAWEQLLQDAVGANF